MKTGQRTLGALLWFLLFSGAAGPVASAGAMPDTGLYAELLGRYVHDGQVDYAGLKKEEARLDLYLESLEKTDTGLLSPRDQFAFYINAYNAWTLKLILGAYPGITSIKDLGSVFKSPWKIKIARIDGDVITLDDIEHAILRPRFKDPRIHFAVNCASRSCPVLGSEPYLGDILDRQLDGATRRFINDPRHNRLEGDTLYVSSIFKWYAGDFDNDIVGFFIRFSDGKPAQALTGNRTGVKIRYLDYDWSLNGR
jgi:hypothetical protein